MVIGIKSTKNLKNMVTTFGEILMRLSPPNNLRLTQTSSFDIHFGGSEANVACSLAQLNNVVQHITRLPENPLSQRIIQDLSNQKLITKNILKGGQKLGIHYIEKGAGQRISTDFYDREHSSFAEIKPKMIDWDKVLEGSTWFHWSGITPAISQSAADTCLEAIEVAVKKGITISVDLNYRDQLWNYGKTADQIMPALLQHCDYIFGGIDAPEKIFGIVPEDKTNTKGELLETDIMSIAEQLLKKFPKAKLFSSTLRWTKFSNHQQLQGMIFLRKGGELYLASVYDMPGIIDRTASGDAFTAGLIHGLHESADDMQTIVNFATAAAVLKHYIHGEVNLSSIDEINNLIRR